MVRNFAGSDFTAHDLYFGDKPVFVFIKFHESDLLSMGPLIKFVCESLMMETLNAYDQASDEMKARARHILWSMDEAGRIGIPNLPEHASTVVGRKISLSLSAQSRSQLTLSTAMTGQKTSLTISGRNLSSARLILIPPNTTRSGWGIPQATPIRKASMGKRAPERGNQNGQYP
jgi:hypothetical protein